jgi:hypothetical protein
MAGCESASAPAPLAVSLIVSGDAPRVGASSQFTALASLSNGTYQVVSSVAVWTTTAPLVATVTSTGVVSGVAPGSVTIVATYQGATGGLNFPVLPAGD